MGILYTRVAKRASLTANPPACFWRKTKKMAAKKTAIGDDDELPDIPEVARDNVIQKHSYQMTPVSNFNYYYTRMGIFQ